MNSKSFQKLIQWELVGMRQTHRHLMRRLWWQVPLLALGITLTLWEFHTETIGRVLVRALSGELP